MEIKANTVVSVDYILTASDDEVKNELVEQTSKEQPFVFLFGHGEVLEEFEANMKGKKAGDSFNFSIVAEKAYGLHDGDHVLELPTSAFMIDGKMDTRVKVGHEVPLQDPDGNIINAEVVEITEDQITVDLNHPLAGYDLNFVGEILSVREASSEELDHGHVHGEHGHHH